MTDQLQDPHHFLPDCLSGWIATLLLDVLGGMFCFGVQRLSLFAALCVCVTASDGSGPGRYKEGSA